ncbi:MAG TPA: hypothetical protein VGY48_15150 [Vicinamibacterales bacterium]|jgi:hypothetical protein|nr:hypothetical protein [Vicinamibacterales bacterium]
MTSLGGERQFAGGCSSCLGADANMSALPGICHPHAPRPLATIKRLQTALRGLAQRTGDGTASVPVDGLVGPHTVRAVNYAVPKYASADPLLASGNLSHAQVVAFAPQLAAAIEQAPIAAPAAPSMPVPPPAPAPSSPSFWQDVAQGTAMYAAQQAQQGGRPMPAPVQYYPPGYAPAPHYPGYGPQRQASVDIKAFVPAQYEHVRFNPVTVAVIIGVGVAAVLITQKREREK